ncbi:KluA regulatory protein [Castellaniella defragrans 65Phen]|uniref:KluA regulatory protein n=2 Tax=Castellaniella defragrans TaxID=75697 RepID=W8X9Q5_CASD6|nr:KluA regulatory protein [Castellaniella defragrans 65Phen]
MEWEWRCAWDGWIFLLWFGRVRQDQILLSRREAIMRTTQQLSITLPNELADVVKSKVRTGEYASESEVIRDGLRALLARDRAVESWLQHQVVPAYDALKADPSRAVTPEQVRARL